VPASAALPQIFPYGVDRPTPRDYVGGQAQASKGVEIELLNYNTVIAGSAETFAGSGVYADTAGTFSNPDLVSRFMLANGDQVAEARVRVDQLQYRVRFRYPVDTLVDDKNGALTDGAGKKWVNPNTQFLLDTPVFDDISLTYIIKPRILDYKEVLE
jgi:hypothetical protein